MKSKTTYERCKNPFISVVSIRQTYRRDFSSKPLELLYAKIGNDTLLFTEQIHKGQEMTMHANLSNPAESTRMNNLAVSQWKLSRVQINLWKFARRFFNNFFQYFVFFLLWTNK